MTKRAKIVVVAALAAGCGYETTSDSSKTLAGTKESGVSKATGATKVNPSVASSESSEPVAPHEPTHWTQSEYVDAITLATTSEGLTHADIAWHATQTFGWDCDEVVDRSEVIRPDNPDEIVDPANSDGYYFVVTCANGLKLQIHPRAGKHPSIRNARGGYETLAPGER